MQSFEAELEKICSDILTVIDEYLVPNAGTPEGRVFYFKMKGDYLRYLAEFQVLDKKKDITTLKSFGSTHNKISAIFFYKSILTITAGIFNSAALIAI